MDIISIFKEKINNIGSLCLLIRNNSDYLNYIESNTIYLDKFNLTLSEKLYYLLNDIDSPLLCNCGKHLKFIGFKNGYRSSCGNRVCYIANRKSTNMERYGVDNPLKSDIIKNKVKETILERYNGKHYMYDEDIKCKIKSTMLEKYGVEYAQQSKEISSKSLDTWNNRSDEYKSEVNNNRRVSNIKSDIEIIEINEQRNKTKIDKYGSIENYNKIVQGKIKETSLLKYGVDHFFKDDIIKNKRVESYIKNKNKKLKDNIPSGYQIAEVNYNKNRTDTYIKISHDICNNEFDITRQLFHKRTNGNEELCMKCNPISNGLSGMEHEISSFLSKYIELESNNRTILGGKELDIYIPSKKLAIEFNGLYWHSELYLDKNYHLIKTSNCNDLNIELMHIWEDNWIYKQDIVKSMLLNKIGQTPNKIYGRKTVIKEITDTKLISLFLDENHLQGKVGSKIKLGLFYNDELVSLMTFGGLRKNLGQRSKEGSYEMMRFCNKKYTNVIGGASKLFKYFIKNYKPNEVISYASRDHSNGNLYKQLGFELKSITEPNYYYIDKLNYLRLNRFGFRKDKLVNEGYDPDLTEHEIMLDRGYYRIYDTGTFKFSYQKTH